MLQDLLHPARVAGPAPRSEVPEPRTLTERAYCAPRWRSKPTSA